MVAGKAKTKAALAEQNTASLFVKTFFIDSLLPHYVTTFTTHFNTTGHGTANYSDRVPTRRVDAKHGAAYNEELMPSSPAPPAVLSPPLHITFLGTGTSTGVPMIGCACAVCHSSDPHNKRMRPSILVTVHGDTQIGAGPQNILVDTTPEMRIQMLRAGISDVSAVLVTHHHADHILGMDDIRQFNFLHHRSMPIYADAHTLGHLKTVFGYAFADTPTGGGKPQLDLTEVFPFAPFEVCSTTVLPLTVLHGTVPIVSYKFGRHFAYVTDIKTIPEKTRPHLRNLDTLVLGCVRHAAHPTHLGLDEALAEIADLAPRQAYLTHLSHHFDHDAVRNLLPANVALGYDGLQFAIPADTESTPPA